MKMAIAAIVVGALLLAFVNLLGGPLTTTSSLGTQTDVLSEIPGFGDGQANGPDSTGRDGETGRYLPNVKVTIAGVQRPHPNDCDPTTEVFIPGGGGKNVDLKKILSGLPGPLADLGAMDWGFCFDRSQHKAGSVTLQDALEKCASDGKSLPQPVHYQDACNADGLAALAHSLGNLEWTSGTSGDAEVANLETCDIASASLQTRLPFRCLR